MFKGESMHTTEEIEQIIEKIWGYDTEAEYNSVEVYISFLRKKMTFLKTEVSIQTARKLGYKLTI